MFNQRLPALSAVETNRILWRNFILRQKRSASASARPTLPSQPLAALLLLGRPVRRLEACAPSTRRPSPCTSAIVSCYLALLTSLAAPWMTPTRTPATGSGFLTKIFFFDLTFVHVREGECVPEGHVTEITQSVREASKTVFCGNCRRGYL